MAFQEDAFQNGAFQTPLSHALWSTWAAIALEHESSAWEARANSLKQDVNVRSTGAEMRSGLQAVTSVAFAMDGWYGATAALLVKKGRREGVATTQRLSNSLRRGTTDRTLRSQEFRGEIDWLFRSGSVRGGAVHHEPRSTEGLQHPARPPNTLSAAEQVIFCAGPATRAVDVLAETVRACLHHPKPKLEPWVTKNRGVLEQLEASFDARPPNRRPQVVSWP